MTLASYRPRGAGRRDEATTASATRITALCVTAWLTASGAASLGLAAGAKRVVSLSPVGTELVLALGHGERLVAVDAASAALPGMRAAFR